MIIIFGGRIVVFSSKYKHCLIGSLSRVCLPCYVEIQNQNKFCKQDNMRRTKSLNDFDKMKDNISKLVRSQQLAQAESGDNNSVDTDSCFIAVLPLELLANILSSLPYEDVKQCRFVSRFWLEAVSLTKFYKRSQVSIPEWVENKEDTLRDVSNENFLNFKLHNFPFDRPDFPLTSLRVLILKDCEVNTVTLVSCVKSCLYIR